MIDAYEAGLVDRPVKSGRRFGSCQQNLLSGGRTETPETMMHEAYDPLLCSRFDIALT